MQENSSATAESAASGAAEHGVEITPRDTVDALFEREMSRWSSLLERLK